MPVFFTTKNPVYMYIVFSTEINYPIEGPTYRERAREIVGLMAAPSVLETGNISSQRLSFLPSQILI
jgi:hypothetical protein